MKTIREWAHEVLGLTGERCSGVTVNGYPSIPHRHICTAVCEKLVEYGAAVREVALGPPPPPSTQTVGGTMIHLGDLDPAVHSSPDGMTTRCGIAMAGREETTLYTVTNQAKVTCADCREHLQ